MVYRNKYYSPHTGQSIMSRELTKKEIYERMIELRNLRKLHATQKKRITALKAENKLLKERVRELEEENSILRGEVADIKYQLTELQTTLFGKKRRARETMEDEDDDVEKPPRTPRSPDSYHRPIPKDEEVTKTVYHRFPRDKNGNIRLRTYYIEDIPLSVRKSVTKHVVEQRYDTKRRTWISKDPLPSSTVILGDNIRVFIATLVTVERLSFEQVRGLLQSLFALTVSNGEIAKILAREATILKPAQEALLTSIREEESHHMDESRYDVRGETRYVWSITGGLSGDTVYRVGVSRGKGNAETLRGDSTGVLISDDYGAYRKLAAHHQLCFAHLIRKFRDLAHHDGFTDAQIEDIRSTYREIKAIYRTLLNTCSGPDPQKKYHTFAQRFTTVAKVHDSDPKPFARLKTTLEKNVGAYLTCLSFPSIALTNNAAERALRHIVLKRKNSFGCRSDHGAEVMGVLFSVLLSLRRKDPATYFENYLGLRRV